MAKLAPMLDRLARHDDAALKAGESPARLVLAAGKRSRIEGDGDFETISSAALNEDDVRDLLLQTGAGSRLERVGTRPIDWTFRHEASNFKAEATIQGRDLRATIVRVRDEARPATAERRAEPRPAAVDRRAGPGDARPDTAATALRGALHEVSSPRGYDPRTEEEPLSRAERRRRTPRPDDGSAPRETPTRREREPDAVDRRAGGMVTTPADSIVRALADAQISRNTPRPPTPAFPPLTSSASETDAPATGTPAAGPTPAGAGSPPRAGAVLGSDAEAWRDVVASSARAASLFELGTGERAPIDPLDVHDRPTLEPSIPASTPSIDLDDIADRIASRRASLPPVFGFDEPPAAPDPGGAGSPSLTLGSERPRVRASLPAMDLPFSSSEPPPPASERAILGARLIRLVEQARKAGASDLHLAEGRPAVARIGGALAPAGEPLDGRVLEEMLLPALTSSQRATLDQLGAVSFAATVGPDDGAPRCRLAISRQRTGLKASVRLLLGKLPTVSDLELPDALVHATRHHQGLVLVSGPSGQGKSTSLAALVDHLNATTTHHILTVEDPIEYVHPRKKAMLSQREVGAHTRSFGAALRSALRQDPDVIVVGELRDVETVRTALSASETGHLVLGTLNTPSAPKTIDRLIDLFPPPEQPQVRATLAAALRLVASQRLLPRKEGNGRVAAVEILPGSLALSNLIRDARTFQIPSLMQRGRAAGVVRLDDELAELVRRGVVDRRDAQAAADDPAELAAVLDGRAPEAAAPRRAQTATPASPPEPGEDRGAGKALWQRAADMFRRGGG